MIERFRLVVDFFFVNLEKVLVRQQQTKMLQKSSFHCIVFIIVVVNICESMASKSSKFSSPSSSCNKTETDQCALNLIPLTNESILRNPPKTLTEINHICQNFMFPMEGCMRRYAMKCMTKCYIRWQNWIKKFVQYENVNKIF